MSDVIVRLADIRKRFGETEALSGVDLELRRGQVHVLAGANGAGKSTLVKILSGVHRPDGGTIYFEGRAVRWQSPLEAARAGVATVHQELSLVGSMTVADNFALVEGGALFAPRDQPASRERAVEALRLLGGGLETHVDTRVERLGLGARQLVEIARALSRKARLLILDEPTSALGDAETDELCGRLETLRGAGLAIVFISHRMEDIYRVGDRISVLRDGRLVASGEPDDLDQRALVQAMVGEVAASPAPPEQQSGETLMDIRGASVLGEGGRVMVRSVDLDLGRGEIVGLAGLEGSGAHELLEALSGARALAAGRVRLHGREVTLRDPRQAIAHGVLLVTGDRGRSVVGCTSVLDNAALSGFHGFLLRRAREREVAGRLLERVELRAAGLDAAVATLSGGNQQKVALTRALLARPKVLLLDDPTRGVDIAAREVVHRMVRELAEGGAAVLWLGSELGELVGRCHRVLVMSRGAVTASLSGHEATRQALLAAAMGAA